MKRSANLNVFTLLFFLILSSLLCLPPTQAETTITSPKIYVQDLVSFNITSDVPIKIKEIAFYEMYKGNITVSGGTNTTTMIGNTSMSYTTTYQLTDKDTDRLEVTIYYYEGDVINQRVFYFYVFVNPRSNDTLYISLGFVAICAILGTFYTYRYIRRKLW